MFFVSFYNEWFSLLSRKLEHNFRINGFLLSTDTFFDEREFLKATLRLGDCDVFIKVLSAIQLTGNHKPLLR